MESPPPTTDTNSTTTTMNTTTFNYIMPGLAKKEKVLYEAIDHHCQIKASSSPRPILHSLCV
jgi:hypothetical protein